MSALLFRLQVVTKNNLSRTTSAIIVDLMSAEPRKSHTLTGCSQTGWSIGLVSGVTCTFWPKKTIHLLQLFKDKLSLKVASIYCIPCDCSKVYVGQTGKLSRLEAKNIRHVHLKQLEKLSVAEHWIDTAHHIDLNSIFILGTATRYMDLLVRDAIKI